MCDHLKLAAKYNLDNLLSVTLLRAEGHYHTVSQALINMTGIATELSVQTLRKLADRMCNGWALIDRRMCER